MILSKLTSIFKKNKKKLILPESLLTKKLKDIVKEKKLLLYENVTIYHQSIKFFIPLLIIDSKHGIYLFEYKNWSYDELRNSTIHKATNEESKRNSLSFERTQWH